jgi:hypothetical protein
VANYAPQTVPFRTILLRLQQVLEEQFSLGDGRVFIVKGGGYSVPSVGEFHLAIRPLSSAVSFDHGGGRLCTPVTRLVAVDIYCRSQIDEAFSDSSILTEETFGLFDLEERVFEALCLEPLLNEDGDAHLLLEPPHPEQPTTDPDAPEPSRYRGYARTTLFFSLKYGLRITDKNLAAS